MKKRSRNIEDRTVSGNVIGLASSGGGSGGESDAAEPPPTVVRWQDAERVQLMRVLGAIFREVGWYLEQSAVQAAHGVKEPRRPPKPRKGQAPSPELQEEAARILRQGGGLR